MNRKTAEAILKLAERHSVSYVPASTDAWANKVMHLTGDDVRLDDIELLLIALQRAGHLTRPEALRLQASYLHEITPSK